MAAIDDNGDGGDDLLEIIAAVQQAEVDARTCHEKNERQRALMHSLPWCAASSLLHALTRVLNPHGTDLYYPGGLIKEKGRPQDIVPPRQRKGAAAVDPWVTSGSRACL